MDYYTLLATASLIIQIIVLILLSYGFFLKQKTKFNSHGMTMAIALVLHIVTIFAIMIPSLSVIIPEFILPAPLEAISIIGIIHGVTGAIAATLGVFLVAAWHFSKNVTGCFKRKLIMRYTISIWATALILGITIYAVLYGPLLFA